MRDVLVIGNGVSETLMVLNDLAKFRVAVSVTVRPHQMRKDVGAIAEHAARLVLDVVVDRRQELNEQMVSHNVVLTLFNATGSGTYSSVVLQAIGCRCPVLIYCFNRETADVLFKNMRKTGERNFAIEARIVSSPEQLEEDVLVWC